MGCHTWFVKSSKIEDQMELLEEQIESGNEFAQNEYDNLYEQNQTGHHDVFRLGGYPDYRLKSLEETLEFLEKHDSEIDYKTYIFDKRDRSILKEIALVKLRKFWELYPEGEINFG